MTVDSIIMPKHSSYHIKSVSAMSLNGKLKWYQTKKDGKIKCKLNADYLAFTPPAYHPKP